MLSKLYKYIRRNKIIAYIIIASIFTLFFVLLLYFWRFHSGFSTSQGDWGTFGDYFGGVFGTIVSLFALIGLIISITITEKQFSQQQEESTFFNLLNLHINKANTISKGDAPFKVLIDGFAASAESIVERITLQRFIESPEDIPDNAIKILYEDFNSYNFYNQTGFLNSEIYTYLLSMKDKSTREKLLSIVDKYKDKIIGNTNQLTNIGINELQFFKDNSIATSILLECFNKTYQLYGHYFGHYFRNMHHILRYIQKCSNKEDYRKIYRAQLSRYEIVVLFYDYMGPNAGDVFIKNVYELNMFQGIEYSDLFFRPTEEEFNTLVKFRYDNRKPRVKPQ